MWPPEYIQLKHIEDLMFCGICYEYMNTSVITSCSHNYCSLCIRKYLHYKTQCPTCFSETFEKDLRKNKTLDEIIAQFLQIKDKLKKCLKSPLQFLPGNKSDGILNTPKSIHEKRHSPLIRKTNVTVSKNIISNNIVSPSINVHKDLSSPSTSGKNKIPLMFTPKSTRRPDLISIEEPKVVICPVCKVTISETNINRHLDDCLKREAKKDQSQINIDSKRQPLPKLVFSLMKDAVMRKKLKEFGLSSQGDRKTMEARLQRYIVLYNAECDKLTPRSVSELIRQCEDEENLEKRMNKTSSFINKLQINRNTEQNIIDEERRKYLEAHKDSFECLIKKIKNTELQRSTNVRRNLLNESFKDEKCVSPKPETIPDSSDDSMNDTETSDLPSVKSTVFIQDSDSDTTCPLQMYSSNDPKKFLNLEFSSCHSDVRINETDSSYNMPDGEKEFYATKHSFVEIEKDDDNSDAHSDISGSNRWMHSATDTIVEEHISGNDSKCVSNSSKYKISKNKEKSFSTNEMKRIDFVTTSRNDLDHVSISDQEDRDCEKHASILQDICCDISSNDSNESKFSNKSNAINYGFFNNSLLNSSIIEKENISSSPECGGSCTYRKRSRDVTQNDNGTISDMKKRIKKFSQPYPSETDVSNEGIRLCDNEEKCLRTKPRLRNRNMNTETVESTTILRKSVRTKRKNNI
ncbi:uncharacterized protein LOC117227274 [Megalopta genalis]|uniref:uncharacterized protein LOC117227274 n=1 Tax=Megalopta genalis TaxID=115081 RepID=UPI003FD2C54F